MTNSLPHLPARAPWRVSSVAFAAGDYAHPASGLVQLRLVRKGSSYAGLDLGVGMKRAFTRPGDLLLTLPDHPTAFHIEEGRELIVLQIQRAVALDYLREAGGADLAALSPLIRRPLRDPLIAELLRRLEARDFATPESGAWAVGAVMASLFHAARKASQPAQKDILSLRGLNALLLKVEQKLGEPWTVAAMARETGLPPRAFAAAFRQAKGLPAHQYLMRARVDRAVLLLQTTPLPLADVAVQAGFAHQAHMTRVVSRLKGDTPSRLRQKPGLT